MHQSRESMMPVMHSNILKAVPMRLLNEEMADRNHHQSLKRLAERGGMDASEIVANITKQKLFISEYKNTTLPECEVELLKLLAAILESPKN